MKAYVAVVKARMSILLQHRAAAASGVCAQIFWGMLKCAVLTAFYENSVLPQSLTLPQAITLMWLGQILLQLLPWVIDPELEYIVKNGNVAYELSKPIDLYWLWFVRSAVYRIAPALCQSIPMYCIAWLFFDLGLPLSLGATIAFWASVMLAALLAASIGTLVVISLFWTMCGSGIQRLLPHTTLLFSGVALPLPLFPSWAQPFLNAQPFRGIIDIPARIYMGAISVSQTPLYLGFQLLWAIVFVVIGRLLVRSACRQFVIQGG